MSRELILIVVVVAFGWATWPVKPGRPGIVPCYTSQTMREDAERLRQDRAGPLTCAKWQQRALWHRLLGSHQWCWDYLERQEFARG